MRAVWEQLVLEQKDGDWAESFSAAAFDGRKNAYSPVPFPLDPGQL
jgi:eukaryotic translation initiation factor 2C